MIEIDFDSSPMEVASRLIYSEYESVGRYTTLARTENFFSVQELKEIADYIYVYVSHHEPPEEEEV